MAITNPMFPDVPIAFIPVSEIVTPAFPDNPESRVGEFGIAVLDVDVADDDSCDLLRCCVSEGGAINGFSAFKASGGIAIPLRNSQCSPSNSGGHLHPS